MKIKTKKQLNLPQLIEWGFENDVTNTWYRASNVEEYISEVYFGATGLPQFTNTVDKQDTFTVEVEEEITEDTRFENLYYMTTLGGIFKSACSTIKSTLEHSVNEPITFYILNDDLTMTLIWTREKGLVE